MISLHSNFTCLSSMCLLYFVCSVLSFSFETNSMQKLLLRNYNMTDAGSKENTNENSIKSANIRAKRSSKTFKEAGESSQMKVLKQFIQLFRNYGAKKPMGGRHPLDPTVPMIFAKVFNSKLVSMLD